MTQRTEGKHQERGNVLRCSNRHNPRVHVRKNE